MVTNFRYPRVCAHCGATFYVKVPSVSQRFCGYSCSAKSQERKKLPVEQRFWGKVQKDGPVPAHRPDLGCCWQWLDVLGPNGYGQFFDKAEDGRTVRSLAHRLSYELVIGPIPEGLQIDHICRNRGCVNPTHLEPVTCRENLVRGEHPSMVTFRSGRCGNGHMMTPENIYTSPSGQRRQCRTCLRDAQRRLRARRQSERKSNDRTG